MIDGTGRGEARVRLTLRARQGIAGRLVRLINVHSGKALSVNGASTADGVNVDQWTYYPGQANQRWDLEDTGNGHKLTSVHSGKALSVTGWPTDDGGNVLQWADESGAHQRWHIQDV